MLARPRTALIVATLAVIGVGQIALGMARDGVPAPTARSTVRADDSLIVDPEPVTLADLRQYGQGTAARAVMTLIYWGQWGSSAGVVGSYAPRVVDGVGAETIADAYRFSRQSLLGQSPVIDSVRRTRSGFAIAVSGRRRNARPQAYTFNAERRDGRWWVGFDSLLENGLAAVTQIETARERGVAEDDPAARAAGITAAQRYRTLSLSPSAGRPPGGP